jgi:hypothetical protein
MRTCAIYATYRRVVAVDSEQSLRGIGLVSAGDDAPLVRRHRDRAASLCLERKESPPGRIRVVARATERQLGGYVGVSKRPTLGSGTLTCR